MDLTNIPTLVAVPFASGAGTGYINPIPVASQIPTTPGAASYTDGFVPVNFQPIASGGVPPFGKDMNGILNALSVANRWNQAGGKYAYNATFATDIGGYPKGAFLERSTQDGFWLSTANNNTTNPDTGGAGWVDPLAGRLIGVQKFSVAGTYPYNETPGTRAIKVLAIGGGGGVGGTTATGAGQCVNAACGGGAGWAQSYITSGFSGQTVTVGAGGTAGTTAPTDGGTGGSSIFMGLTAAGGIGSAGRTALTYTNPTYISGGAGGTGTGGNIANGVGSAADVGAILAINMVSSGLSGASLFGGAAVNAFAGSTGPVAARAGVAPGSGAVGAVVGASHSGQAGAAGADGIVIIEEYA